MTVVKVEKLCKTYQMGPFSLEVLKSLDLDIKQGEYVAIMGPSGSGKSTLLNMLGCLDKPTSGSYHLDGQNVAELDDDHLSQIRGKRIGFIFQSYNLIPQLDVLENIQVPMIYQGINDHECRKRAKELAEMVGLGDRIKHRPSELSGGQQQRVAIARALSNDPVLIMADEPTGNLDTKSGADILNIIDNLNKAGKTIIAVTHGNDLSERAGRVLHMLDGRINRDISNA
ncbi:MAG: ABC transporter ATP-binding protein [Phycisphaerae bacterium]|nr:ABC transporter ATP-binding protein [Phycisphaerae bacterium]